MRCSQNSPTTETALRWANCIQVIDCLLCQFDGLHHFSRLFTSLGVHEEILHEHTWIGIVRIAALRHITGFDIGFRVFSRNKRRREICSLCVSSRNAIALRLRRKYHKLEICSIQRNILKFEWNYSAVRVMIASDGASTLTRAGGSAAISSPQ